ncbi:hypothetical protein CFter6_3629 [Collimonas fungivorans]|uniref:Uncharacterized protein n=1 Tax=Collimonas fungivorans TaxID=158899 RepID=A0A127PEW2_9BURK|nr:hypothetical protein CFter6_3629 [Collimonas fungivorans]
MALKDCCSSAFLSATKSTRMYARTECQGGENCLGVYALYERSAQARI